MGLHTFASTSLEALSKGLAGKIKAERTNILQKDFVITPGNGLDNWLKVQIAEQNGIAANIQFVTITKMAEIIYKVLAGKEDRKDALSATQLQWILFELLGTDDFAENFDDKASYFKDNPQKRLALAGKVTALFANYQAIIPGTLIQWKGEDEANNEHEKWQKYLWLKLKERTIDDFVTSSDSFEFIKEKIKETAFQETLKTKLPVIYLFNLNEISKVHIDLLIEVGQHIDVNIYFFTPLKQNEDSGNSLLKSWIGNQKLLLDYLKAKDVSIQFIDNKNSPADKSLLHKIQLDILDNRTRENRNEIFPVGINDGSLVINACYTPTREVEVLYNYLVHTLNKKNSTIGARDIAVICTDITKYSAAIKAVFETAPYKLPYHVLDYPGQDTNSPLMALEALFNIDPRWFKPELVMHLLEYPAVRNKFGIKDVSFLRSLVNKANIRNGYDGSIKENETHLISWEHGLNRLFLGYCMGGNEAYELGDKSYLLVDETEGSSASDLVGFRYFVKRVKGRLDELGENKTLADWIEFIKETIGSFISVEGENSIRMGQLDRELASLSLLNSKQAAAVPFSTFYSSLKEIMSGISTDNKILRKGITFCSSKPSRSVPFKIIAMLGLNYDSFPRKYNKLSFDLTIGTEEGKMNNEKERDKFFFLETLLSAKEKLYLSYIGWNVKNNAKFPPSLLVDELVDYVQVNGNEVNSIVVEHPLHGFDSKYFSDHPAFYTYLGKNEIDKHPDFFKEPDPDEKKELKEISVHKFVNFLKDPFKYYYNNGLGIYYKDEEELLSDEELFDLDNLQKWSIKNQVVKSEVFIEDNSPQRIALVEMGQLPLANPGKILLNEVSKETENMRTEFQQQIAGKAEEKIKIDLLVDGVRVNGQIGNVYGDDFIYNNVSKNKNQNDTRADQKKQIEAFIYYLLLHKAEKTKNLVFNSISGACCKVPADKISPEQREEILNKIMWMIKEGSEKIIPFSSDLLNKMKDVSDILKRSNEKGEEISGAALISNAFNSNPFLSPYIKKEMEAGYFNNPVHRTELFENLEFVHQNILQNF